MAELFEKQCVSCALILLVYCIVRSQIFVVIIPQLHVLPSQVV